MDNTEKILEFIKRYHKEHGYAPTYREIAKGVGISSTASIAYHVNRLKREGKIDFEPTRARAMTIKEEQTEQENKERGNMTERGEVLYQATIPMQPVTKKNSQKIGKSNKTGKYFILQSEKYQQYARGAQWFLTGMPEIDEPVNVEMKFYMKDRHRVDLSNLQSAALDILVGCGILKDDNCNIVVAHDGSRVFYCPDMEGEEEPRTEITITRWK